MPEKFNQMEPTHSAPSPNPLPAPLETVLPETGKEASARWPIQGPVDANMGKASTSHEELAARAKALPMTGGTSFMSKASGETAAAAEESTGALERGKTATVNPKEHPSGGPSFDQLHGQLPSSVSLEQMQKDALGRYGFGEWEEKQK